MNNLELQLKQCLLDYDLCIDNSYLDQYVILVVKYIGWYDNVPAQKHHAIPVKYYQEKFNLPTRVAANPKASQDLNNFTVHLPIKEHLLAHMYLAMCGKTESFKSGNAAVIHLIMPKLTIDELIEIKSLDCFTEVYNLSRLQAKKSTKPFLAGNKNPQYGKIYIHNENEIRVISPDELELYLHDGWLLGRTTCTRCHIHKDGVYKNIYIKDLTKYLEAGWIYGAAGKPRKK